MKSETYDVVIVGGGPAGLSVALTLGRARKRVLLCDAGTRRNAAAVHVHNFVTRDGITPAEFRRIGRQQLEPYTNVEARDVGVREIAGTRGAFKVLLEGEPSAIEARRIVLCTGMLDEPPAIDGVRELWGTAIFQCPYCHGWEVQDQRFAYLASNAEALAGFAPFLRAWTSDVVALTNGAFEIPPEVRANVVGSGVRIEERRIVRLIADADRRDRLERIEFADGESIERDALFVHPVQHQVGVVRALGVALDDKGYVKVDEMTRETSIPGIYAAGDLLTSAQSAILSAAAGMRAAAMVNHALTLEMVTAGAHV